MSIWLKSGARHWIAVRRSHGKRGRIPHASAIAESGPLKFHDRPDGTWYAVPDGSTLYVLEYAPPEGQCKDSITQAGAFPLLFSGLYYLRRYRLESVGTGDTLRDAVRSSVPTKAHAD